jgi:hypothetical protein
LNVTFACNAGCLEKKKLYNGIPNVTMWRVLRKPLHLNAYKVSIVQHFERWIFRVERWIVRTPTIHTICTIPLGKEAQFLN